MTRRTVLRYMMTGVAFAMSPGVPKLVLASLASSRSPISGKLSFYNIHTSEVISLNYLDKKRGFDPKALEALNHFFRCHYTGKVYPIKPELYVLLDEIRTRLGKNNRRYRLISGYRSPEYNRKLCRTNGGVAQKSYHLKGMAADVRLSGVSLNSLHRKALDLKKGGVGKYSRFIHIDVGPVRWW